MFKKPKGLINGAMVFGYRASLTICFRVGSLAEVPSKSLYRSGLDPSVIEHAKTKEHTRTKNWKNSLIRAPADKIQLKNQLKATKVQP